MANQPGRRRNQISLPGQRINMSRDTLRQLLSQNNHPSASSTSPEYIMKEVKPVQECGYSRSSNMNITEPEHESQCGHSNSSNINMTEPETDESQYGHSISSNMNITEPADESQCGHSISSNMHITEPEADESHFSFPVSDYGQRGRSHYRSRGSNPASDEACTGQVLEDRQNQLVQTDGLGDTHESKECNIRQMSDFSPSRDKNTQRQQNAPRRQSENFTLNLNPTNVHQPQNTRHSDEQDLNTPKEHEYESSSSSFLIPDSQLSFKDSLKDMLNSTISQRSVKDPTKHSEKLEELLNILSIPNQQGSEKFEDLINSLQTKWSITNQEDKASDSIKIMLLSLIEKVYKKPYGHDMIDASLPSLQSFLLMLSINRGKNSFDPTCQQPSQVHPDYEMMAVLEADCLESNCSKSLCQMVQHCLSRFQNSNVSVTDLTQDEQRVLSAMCDHCRICEYLHCPLYWCQKGAVDGMNGPKETLAKMKQSAEHGYHGNFLDDMKKGSFAKGLPWTAIPNEPEDWCGLCLLQGASNTILVKPTDETRGEYWVIKKCPMYKSHSQMDLYETLRQITDPGIALHLWTAFCPDTRYMVVCTGFEEFSLYEELQNSPIKNLEVVKRIMVQLIHTTQHLHENDILYLNWSSKNVVYRTYDCIKLTNFTCSAIKSRVDGDIKDIILSLPRHLIAPEMLEKKPEADEGTDIRGLGCLLKEILSGQPVWYEYLHEPKNVLKKKIMEGNPSRPHDCLELELFQIFRACWERDRSIRPNLGELEMHLLRVKPSHPYI